MRYIKSLGMSIALVAIAGTGLSRPAAAQSYSPTDNYSTSWSTSTNPNGVWNYGWSTGLPSNINPITLFTETTNAINGPTETWYDPDENDSYSPAVEYGTAAYNEGNVFFSANELYATGLGPNGTDYADVQFVAPKSGEYSISGTFFSAQAGDNADVHILANGTTLFSGTIVGSSVSSSYSGDVSLLAGQDIDFLFGGNGDTALHAANVGLTADIQAVPEASSLISFGVLMTLGGLMFLARRRRFSATLSA